MDQDGATGLADRPQIDRFGPPCLPSSRATLLDAPPREVSQNMTVWPRPTVIHFAQFRAALFSSTSTVSSEAGAPLPLDIVCVACRRGAALSQPAAPQSARPAGTLGGSPDAPPRGSARGRDRSPSGGVSCRSRFELGIRHGEPLHDWLAILRPPHGRSRASSDAGCAPKVLPTSPASTLPPSERRRPSCGQGGEPRRKGREPLHGEQELRATERALEMLSQAHDVDVTTD